MSKIDDNSVPPPPEGFEQVSVKSNKLDMKQQNLSARTFTREETGTNLSIYFPAHTAYHSEKLNGLIMYAKILEE